jgi:hypothetical protein
MLAQTFGKPAVRSWEIIRDLAPRSEQTENKAMEQTDLHAHRTVARLPLADHMNRFIARDRAPGSPEAEGAKMLACTHPAFDGPMVLFQDIIEVLHRAMPAIVHQSTLGFELHKWLAEPACSSV